MWTLIGRRPHVSSRKTSAKLSSSYLLLAGALAASAGSGAAPPDLASGTSDEPITALVGQDVFVSCVAKNLQNYSLTWRFSDEAQAAAGSEQAEAGRVLTAGRERVIADERFSVIQAHDTWLLKIANAQLADSGTYICQANSAPPVRALRILSVVRSGEASDEPAPFHRLEHNFTECCAAEQVSTRCQRLCTFQQLASRYQSINMVHECYSSLAPISGCMVAGRNLTDCCERRHVPSRCRPLCGHQGQSGAGLSVQDQARCADYSAVIMSCVADGLSTLPAPPELVVVEAVSSSQLKVSWQKVSAAEELRRLDGWMIVLTKLRSFEDARNSSVEPAVSRSAALDAAANSSLAAMARQLEPAEASVSLRLDKALAEFTINALRPYTVYQVQMYAYNSAGSSQLSEPIRALTLAPGAESAQPPADDDKSLESPKLPDTRRCCLERGVTLKRCLDSLCDPVEADRATVADLMICAPWSNATFGCLSSHVDHTECCRARGVTPFCLSMCSGEVRRVDHRHFRCLAHMGAYSSCILEFHDVLASAPRNFSVGPVARTWAVLDWRAPERHARSLQGYRIFWRPAEGEEAYASADAAANPYLLDALEPGRAYETFVVAVNRFGESARSARFRFETQAEPAASLAPTGGYNETACCASAGVGSACLGLCSYQMQVADAGKLVSASCSAQLPAVMRCLAGSRNSVPCCRARQVSEACLNVCAGLTEHSPLVVATRCAADFATIIGCMDEGSRQIPSAPVGLHAAEVWPDRVRLQWRPAPEDALRSDVEYHVRYQQLEPATGGADASDPSALVAVVPLHPLEHKQVLSVAGNRTEATLSGLRPASRYSVYVTAENAAGISLPSLVLVLQTAADEREAGARQAELRRGAALGAAHSLELVRAETDSVAVKWLAPLYVEADAALRYRVFYKLLDNSSAPAANWSVLETADTGAVLRNLRYSAQYVVTVQAVSRQALGHMSEVLIAATLRPVPPTLNQPLVIGQPVEGGNVTLMCVALGQPQPQISMFINGLLVQKRAQPYVIYHLVRLVRGQLTVSCFASNGHGKDYASVQSRTEIWVRFGARLRARAPRVRAVPDATARLTCQLEGNPAPGAVAWAHQAPGANQSQPVRPDARVSTLAVASEAEQPFSWTHTLLVRNVTPHDAGLYTCSARNALGDARDQLRLDVLAAPDQQVAPLASDMLECCRGQNVSAACLPACAADGLDVDTALRLAECEPELDKLMVCAADGSDHRACCRSRQVPPGCLRWCSGARLTPAPLCFLSAAHDINQCFQEGRGVLPGPPRALRASLAAASRAPADPEPAPPQTGPLVGVFSDALEPADEAPAAAPAERARPVLVEWAPPAKNPALVQVYRVFWRQVGSRQLARASTRDTWIRLDQLESGRQYELVVKAANSHGASVYSEPLRLRPDELVAEQLPGFVLFGAGHLWSRLAAGLLLASALMGAGLALVCALERRGYLRRFASAKSRDSRVSFANPAYSKHHDEAANVQLGTSLHVLGPLPAGSANTEPDDGPQKLI